MFENRQYKIVVAHPDDEILFFNSVISSDNTIIICYGPSSTKAVSDGREKLKSGYPFRKVVFLDIPEANVYDGVSFAKRKVTSEGVSVTKNSDKYNKNYDQVLERLSSQLSSGDTVFTHNPWGEYGHPEHVQVFNAIYSLMDELKLTIFVNGYVSDKTSDFMFRRLNLISSESFLRNPDDELGQKVKRHYIDNNCWTWNSNYHWPATEIFYRLHRNGEVTNHLYLNSASLPLTTLTGKFTHGLAKHLASRFLPPEVKAAMKKILRIR